MLASIGFPVVLRYSSNTGQTQRWEISERPHNSRGMAETSGGEDTGSAPDFPTGSCVGAPLLAWLPRGSHLPSLGRDHMPLLLFLTVSGHTPGVGKSLSSPGLCKALSNGMGVLFGLRTWQLPHYLCPKEERKHNLLGESVGPLWNLPRRRCCLLRFPKM